MAKINTQLIELEYLFDVIYDYGELSGNIIRFKVIKGEVILSINSWESHHDSIEDATTMVTGMYNGAYLAEHGGLTC